MKKSTDWLSSSVVFIICFTQLKKDDQKIYLLNQLKENKGMVSSALGKKLAKEFLSGKTEILDEALELIHFDDKNVRSGAAKIIETIAEEKPELISKFLSGLIQCLKYPEAQTRWMILHIAGLCAQYQPEISRKIFQEAVKYLHKKHGTVLNDRAILYFGYMGSVSKEDCDHCFPYLIDCFSIHPNRITRIFESLERLSHHMDANQKQIYNTYIKKYLTSDKPSVRRWANKARKFLII